MTIREMLEKRAALVKSARELVDRADEEKRDLSAEEQETYDKHFAEIGKMDERIKKEEALREAERAIDTVEVTDVKKTDGVRVAPNATEEYRAAFREYLLNGKYDARALQMDLDESGGFTVVPEQFVKELLKAVDNQVFIRQYAKKFNVPNAAALGVPSLDADPADATWTAEIAIGSEDSTMDFGKRELKPYPLAQYIKVSRKLLRASAFNIEALINERLAYKFGVVEENAFLNGSGAGQPLGVFTASDDGVGTARDVSTGNAATSIGFDGLIGAKYHLKEQYHRNARWIFHRDAVAQISKLKDGEGQYIWRPSVIGGEPDRLLNFPVHMSEYAPNTFTTTLYVGILGDFSYYWIADALNMEIQRLNELYAATNQIGFIGRKETDGMPVMAEAFARVKLG